MSVTTGPWPCQTVVVYYSQKYFWKENNIEITIMEKVSKELLAAFLLGKCKATNICQQQ